MHPGHSLPGWRPALIAAAILGGTTGAGLARAQPLAGDDTASAGNPAGEVILVTGSLIEQPISLVTLPVQILDRQDLAAAGLPSTGDVLQDLPAQGNAINTQFNAGGDGSTRVSLRGLGVGRSLVLINGRRYVSGGDGVDGTVDLGSIPIHVIDRIEVLKDGGAPLYGSGAIGGVVNIITRTDFDGIESNLHIGYSPSLGRALYDLSVGGGYRKDRAQIAVQVNYFDHPPLYAGEREFSRDAKVYNWATGEVIAGGGTATPQGYIRDYGEAPGNAAWQDLVNRNPGAVAFHLDPEAGWRRFENTGNSDTGEGDYYNYRTEEYLITPVRRLHLYSRAVWEQSEQLRGYAEVFYTNRTSSQRGAPISLFTVLADVPVSADNYYNPFGRPFIDVRRRMVEAGVQRERQNSHTLQLFAGIEGGVPEDAPLLRGWRWDLSYGLGQNRTTSILKQDLLRRRLENAIGPSHLGPDGSPRCGTPEAPIDGCVPLNLFGGAGTITPEMLSYVAYSGIESGENQLHQALFTASGRLLGDRGGRRLSLAVGAEYQRHSGSYLPDPLVALDETVEARTNAVTGEFDARETYAELSLIPIVGSSLARHLELVGAVRFSDFPTDAFATWQVRGAWQSAFGLSLRGGYYRMFRAPSIADLFAPVAEASPAVTDPCRSQEGPRPPQVDTNCTLDGLPPSGVVDNDRGGNLPGQVGGSGEVTPERATALNLGAAYHPPFLPGLGLELSWFHLEMNSQVQSIGAEGILQSCYQTSPDQRRYCDRIHRDPSTGLITLIDDTLANVDAGPVTSGLDIAVRYRLDTLLAGTFGLDWEAVRLLKYNLRQLDGSVVHGRGVYDLGMFPEWKYNVSASWWSDSWEANARLAYIGSLEECESNNCRAGPYGPPQAPISRTVGAWSSVGFSIAYTEISPLGTSKLTLGASNVFDSQPPAIYNGLQASTDAATYDFMGRYLYTRFEQMF